MTDDHSQAVRRHVIYHGIVQGVCFRMISRELSQNYQVVGYVRNLPDGTVELEAEGRPEEVEGFLGAVGREFKSNIRQAEMDNISPRRGETGFHITY